MSRMERIQQKLASLNPTQLNIIDESHRHAGHAGARNGGGHYIVEICSPQFTGKNTMARHRMIYSALGDMMQREIHALSIRATTPAQQTEQETE